MRLAKRFPGPGRLSGIVGLGKVRPPGALAGGVGAGAGEMQAPQPVPLVSQASAAGAPLWVGASWKRLGRLFQR